MFCPKYIFVYILIAISFIFMGLYVWRRIYGMECYVKILEKKVANLKKENKDLNGLLCSDKGNCSLDESDIIMNSIFMCDKPNTPTPISKASATEIVHISDAKDDVKESVQPATPATPAMPTTPAKQATSAPHTSPVSQPVTQSSTQPTPLALVHIIARS
jgi:hypothetical protein